MAVPVTTEEKDAAVDGLLDYNDMQQNGASDSSPYAVDDVVVGSSRAQQYGQSNTPLFLPYDKIDPGLSDVSNMAPEQIVYKQLSDNGVLPIFLAVARMVQHWTTTTRAHYTFSIGTVSSFTHTNTGNLPHSTSVSMTGVPVDSPSLLARYVEIIRVSTSLPVVVLAGPQAGERVYGVVSTSGGTSPNSIVVDLYSRPFGGDPALSWNPYTWESGNGPFINFFYGFRQRLDQLDDTAFRRVFR